MAQIPSAAWAKTLDDPLRWFPSPDVDVVGYVVHVGSTPGFIHEGGGTAIDIGEEFVVEAGVASYPMRGLLDGSSYVVMRAYNRGGLYSDPSNEIFVEIQSSCVASSDCSDGDVCNGIESCVGGVCVTGTLPQCAAPTECQVESCDALLGCVAVAVPDGSTCNDGDASTFADRCSAGVCQGDGPAAALYLESFDSYRTGTDPEGWVDTGAGNSMVVDDSLFHTREVSAGASVLETTSTSTDIHSHLVHGGSEGWSDYEFAGRMKILDWMAGIGVTVYSDYANSDRYYRLRRFDNGPSFHLAPHGDGVGCTGTTTTGVSPAENVWYHFRFQAAEEAADTRLRAKIWSVTEPEPADWQVDCVTSGAAFRSGAPGLWAMGAGAKQWDDLAVFSLADVPTAPSPAPDCIVDVDCGDGDACNGFERCAGGSCVPGESLLCADPGPCRLGSCDPQLGCVEVPVQDGLECSDGNACTAGDRCVSGACVAAEPLVCGDAGQCLVGRCDATSGCMSEPVVDGASCDDGDPLTVQDACFQGACQGVAPPPPPDPAPEPEPAPEPVDGQELFYDDFESYGVGDDPSGWFDTNGANALSEAPELFEVAAMDDGNLAMATYSTKTNIHSHYIADESSRWWDYEYVGRMMIGDGRGGIGVTIFSDYPNSDSYLRLRRYEGAPSFHLAPHPHSEGGACFGSTDTGVVPEAGSWYVFRFRATSLDGGVHVQARVWDERDPEPGDWQIDCQWSGSVTAEGAPGLWSMGPGGKFWDDLGAFELVPAEPGPVEDPAHPPAYFEDFDSYREGDDPSGWLDTGPRNSLSEEPSLFAVAATSADNLALSTSERFRNMHSHLLASGADSWANYEYSGRMMMTDRGAGIGVTLYSDYPSSDTYYRLHRYSSRRPSFKLSTHSGGEIVCDGTVDTGVRPDAMTWYRFRFRALAEGDGTRLQARVWRESEPEPAAWQADCLASGAGAPISGTAGVWAMSRGSKFWDDLEVTLED